ncbi:hypothetical protein ACFPIF_00065 [Brevundimonas faecalis]|uniref:hypothetical protein n=1 Tax=Brevundimonas faecalis TaxID=947378 RepID=UPI00361C25DC
MLTSIAGDDFALSPGDVTDRFTDEEAARMIEAGMALPEVGEKVERAAKTDPKKETR